MAAKDVNVPRERELIVRAQAGDMLARGELHREYSRLLDKLMYQSFSAYPGVPKATLRAKAEEILDDCLTALDPNRKTKPSTYIMGYIEQKLKRFAGAQANPVRSTENYMWDFGRHGTAKESLIQELGTIPTYAQTAARMNENDKVTRFNPKIVKRIEEAKRITTFATSNISGSGDGELQAGDQLFTQDIDPMEEYQNSLKFADIMAKLQMLPQPDKSVMLYHFGLGGNAELSIRGIALKLGLNKYRVETIIADQTAKLRGDFGGL